MFVVYIRQCLIIFYKRMDWYHKKPRIVMHPVGARQNYNYSLSKYSMASQDFTVIEKKRIIHDYWRVI